jgi:hypothetical protein
LARTYIQELTEKRCLILTTILLLTFDNEFRPQNRS